MRATASTSSRTERELRDVDWAEAGVRLTAYALGKRATGSGAPAEAMHWPATARLKTSPRRLC